MVAVTTAMKSKNLAHLAWRNKGDDVFFASVQRVQLNLIVQFHRCNEMDGCASRLAQSCCESPHDP